MNEIRLIPVILAVPQNMADVKGRDKTAFLSLWARRALGISAEKAEMDPGPLLKNDKGAPVPSKGIFWSVSHKPFYVGGVCATFPIGLDIECIRDLHEGMYEKTASDDEWRLLGGRLNRLFFRMWTGKESVLKKAGTGIGDLMKCRLIAVESDAGLVFTYQGERHVVEQHHFGCHIASVTAPAGLSFSWVIIKEGDVDWPSYP